MGMLFPLYLAGLAALSLPLILHLIRRTPRGRQDFSSLMFLMPSPPRLTRRSRLDQILLLLLRLAALALLAVAFSRPFLRESAMLSLDTLPSRRVAILLDTSASMRRADLWRQAVRKVEEELNELAPHDEVALFAFEDRVQPIVEFDRVGQAFQPATRADLVRQRLRKLSPGWGATDLGAALVAVAGELDAATDVDQTQAEPRIVVISDFQKGSRTETLQAFEWPERVRVVTHTVSSPKTTNAFAHLLQSEEETADDELRVRIVNATDSSGDQFFVAWSVGQAFQPASSERQAEKPALQESAVYVPPGQSRVIRLPLPENNPQADRITLRGDDHEFDNTFYVVPPRRQNLRVLYAGADRADDPRGLQYYLRLALAEDPLRHVDVQPLEDENLAPLNDLDRPPLVVASQAVSAELQGPLKAYLEQGGTIWLVPKDRTAAESLPLFLEDIELREPTAGSPYLLLGTIDFTHPLFAPFANPRYSDFTKIHFWKHQPVTLKAPSTTQLVASFDNGDPAVLERPVGKGRVIALLSGWNPDASQLALSSKFVPLVNSLLDMATGGSETLASVTVHQPVSLDSVQQASVIVYRPDGNTEPATSRIENTDQPGIYRALAGTDELRFAVNLASNESNTAPLELEQLEQMGVRFGAGLTRAERLERIRQQRDTELESRQKVWRWLVVATLGFLIFETWWAGRAARLAARPMENS